MSTELTTPIKIEIPGIGTIESADLYLKSEVDKVIAELENRIDEGDKEFDVANEQNERLLKIVRHQKYKRCLAMAMWCDSENYTACWYHENSERCKWTEKWYQRWLELAEKFKEIK